MKLLPLDPLPSTDENEVMKAYQDWRAGLRRALKHGVSAPAPFTASTPPASVLPPTPMNNLHQCFRITPPYSGTVYVTNPFPLGFYTDERPATLIQGNTGGGLSVTFGIQIDQVSGIFADFVVSGCVPGSHLLITALYQKFGELTADGWLGGAEVVCSAEMSAQNRNTGRIVAGASKRIGQARQVGVGHQTLRLRGEFDSVQMIVPWFEVSNGTPFRIHFSTYTDMQAYPILPLYFARASASTNIRLDSLQVCCVEPIIVE